MAPHPTRFHMKSTDYDTYTHLQLSERDNERYGYQDGSREGWEPSPYLFIALVFLLGAFIGSGLTILFLHR